MTEDTAAPDRTIRLLYLLYALEGATLAITSVFAPFLLLAWTETGYMTVALVFALPSLGVFLGGNVWGVAVDHVGRVRPFLMLAAGATATTLLVLCSVKSGSFFVAGATTASFLMAAMRAAGQAYVTLAHPDRVGAVLGRLFTAEAAGWSLSGAAAGMVLEGMGADEAAYGLLLRVAAGLWLAAFVLVATMADDGRLPCNPGEQVRGSLLGELLRLYRLAGLRSVALVVAVANGANTLFFGMYSTYFCRHLGGGRDVLGLSLAASGLAGVVVFVWMGRQCDRVGPWRMLQFAAGAYGLLFASFCWLRSPVAVAVFYTLPIYPALRIAASVAAADLTSTTERGGGLGILDGAVALSGFIGPVIGGALVQWDGFGRLPSAAAIGSCLALLAALIAGARYGIPASKPIPVRAV